MNNICNVCESTKVLDRSCEQIDVFCNVKEFRDHSFTVWRCPGCRSLHCLQEVDLDAYYRNYPIKSHKLDFWARAAYQNLLNRLLKLGVSQTDRILDYGCGPGLFVRYLQEHGYANARGYDAFVPEFASRSIFDYEYDVVVAQDVIEHTESPKEFLEEILSLVRPGGLLTIGTPNANRIDLNQPEKYSLSIHMPYHRHILSQSALLKLAEKLGLVVLKIYNRFYYDTLFPTVNFRFLKTYVEKGGNFHDVAFEEARVGLVMKSPTMWFHAVFGYFFPPRSEQMIVFRKNHLKTQQAHRFSLS